MKKTIFAFLFQLSIICVVNAQPGIGFSTYVGVISAYRFPGGDAFSINPVNLKYHLFAIRSLKATGYNGSRRLRGYGYLGNNTDDFANNATHKFMQIRLVDSWIPNKNTLRVGWRYTNRDNSIPNQYELGIYSHINHKGDEDLNGREAHTFGLATYKKFKMFEYSLIISRRHGFAARIQYQGIDSTAWIVRTIHDWKTNGFTLSDAEATLWAKKETLNVPPIPSYINAFTSSVITPSFNEPKFWHVNVGMINTWIKSGESKEVTAKNYINLLLESTVFNDKNTSHPPSSDTPYLKVESGGMLIVESKGTIKTDISSNQYSHKLIDMSYGSNVRFIIVP